MKNIHLLLLSVLLLSACAAETEPVRPIIEEPQESSVDLSTNDFTPPIEVERGMENAGPYEMRLLSATSEDGLTWTRTNTIISEQANVPDMVVTEDGTIFLYYVGGNILGLDQSIAVAVSTDNGVTWTFKKVTIENREVLGGDPGDPDVVIREDGSYRLYFTSQIKGSDGPSIQYADGTDGFNFTYKGEAFKADGYTAIDSSAFFVDGHWAMNTFSGFDTEVIHGVSSDDGESFEFVQAKDVKYNNQPVFLSNSFTLPDDSVRFYSFDFRSGDFRSFVTTDGLTWEDEGNLYLSYEEGKNPLEGFYIKDPAVVQLPDGSFFMVYVTRAPY